MLFLNILDRQEVIINMILFLSQSRLDTFYFVPGFASILPGIE